MEILIFGAGTIGLSYGYLLSHMHEVTFYVREEKMKWYEQGINMEITDLRKKSRNKKILYRPDVTIDFKENYDLIIITVSRNQLLGVLPAIQAGRKNAKLLFMLNHWDIEKEVEQFFSKDSYSIGFPSQIGGGREADHIKVTLFPKGTILENSAGSDIERAFTDSGFTVEIKKNIAHWMKVHYLQQAITGAAILKAGSYELLCKDYKAIKDMVYAYKEGLEVCRAYGINTKEMHPAKLFYYPVPFITILLKSMFQKDEIRNMITSHMNHGINEWIYGYYEVLKAGKEKGVFMPVWESYKVYTENYRK